MKQGTIQRTVWGTAAVVILLAIATSPFWTVVFIRQQTTRMVDDTLLGLTTSGLAHINISESFLETSMVVAATDPAVREKSIAEISEMMRRTDAQLQAYQATIRDPADRENFDRLIQQRLQFRATRQKVLDLLSQGQREAAVHLYSTDGLREYQAYLGALDQIVQYNVADAKASGRQILRWCNFLLIVQGVLVIFFFIYAFYVPLLAVLERMTTRRDVVEDI